MHGRYGSILPLKLAPTGTRFTLETRFKGESDDAIARSFDEDQLHAAFFLLHAPLWSIPGFRPSPDKPTFPWTCSDRPHSHANPLLRWHVVLPRTGGVGHR